MICPECGSNQIIIVDSRQTKHNYCRRRRECIECGNRFTTIEFAELSPEIFTAIHRIMTMNRVKPRQFEKVLIDEYQKRFERRKYYDRNPKAK